MAWHITGDYFENCNCDVICPCPTYGLQGPADNERCFLPLFVHIEDGENDGVRLDGLNFVLVIDAPQVMAEGDWRVAGYVDERADDQQRQALGAILSGELGGPPEAIAGLVGEQLGVKFVPIEYEIDGERRRLTVPGIMEFEVESLKVPGSEDPAEVNNVFHPMGSRLPVGKSVRGVYDDSEFGFSFDNSGKNGHIAKFAWAA